MKMKMKMTTVDYKYACDDKRGQDEQKMHLKFTDQEAIRSRERKIEIVLTNPPTPPTIKQYGTLHTTSIGKKPARLKISAKMSTGIFWILAFLCVCVCVSVSLSFVECFNTSYMCDVRFASRFSNSIFAREQTRKHKHAHIHVCTHR